MNQMNMIGLATWKTKSKKMRYNTILPTYTSVLIFNRKLYLKIENEGLNTEQVSTLKKLRQDRIQDHVKVN